MKVNGAGRTRARRLGGVAVCASAAAVGMVAIPSQASAMEAPLPPGIPGVLLPAPYTSTVLDDGLRVRNGPGRDHDARGQLYEMDRVKISHCRGDWARVKLLGTSAGGLHDGTRGWVAAKYVLPGPVPEVTLTLPPGCSDAR
ncbi:SH3 domain-containing protein [Streptomyces sp. NPDC048172]|uniref:SH3 domain-containing protein n=1 Tax=Streptomyces sp. NPDC048172 TaxID=3365505 RepID=UPI00371B9ED2